MFLPLSHALFQIFRNLKHGIESIPLISCVKKKRNKRASYLSSRGAVAFEGLTVSDLDAGKKSTTGNYVVYLMLAMVFSCWNEVMCTVSTFLYW